MKMHTHDLSLGYVTLQLCDLGNFLSLFISQYQYM